MTPVLMKAIAAAAESMLFSFSIKPCSQLVVPPSVVSPCISHTLAPLYTFSIFPHSFIESLFTFSFICWFSGVSLKEAPNAPK